MHPIYREPTLKQVRGILEANALPTHDLAELDLSHFFACGESADPKGIIGLEVHGCDGLLRSLAVDSSIKGQGAGYALLQRLEEYAKSIDVSTLFLLTETAETFFERQGFESIARDSAPTQIKQTREFSGLCPDSATLMRKDLTTRDFPAK